MIKWILRVAFNFKISIPINYTSKFGNVHLRTKNIRYNCKEVCNLQHVWNLNFIHVEDCKLPNHVYAVWCWCAVTISLVMVFLSSGRGSGCWPCQKLAGHIHIAIYIWRSYTYVYILLGCHIHMSQQPCRFSQVSLSAFLLQGWLVKPLTQTMFFWFIIIL